MSELQEPTIRPSPRVRWIVWLAFALCWFTALVVPIPIKPSTGLRSPLALFTFAKTLHVLAYATFAVLTGWLVISARFRWFLLLVLIGHALLSELAQWSFPDLGRTGSFRDVGIDLAAITLGVAVSWKWWAGKRPD